MGDFIKNYGSILVPVAVAVIGGIFGVIKLFVKKDKGATGVNQSAKNIKDSSLNQVGGDININGNINISAKNKNKV